MQSPSREERTRRKRAERIHVPTLEWKIGHCGRTLDELEAASRRTRHPVSKRTIQRALRGQALDWRSRAGIADILELSIDELERGSQALCASRFNPGACSDGHDELHRTLGASFVREAQRMIGATNPVDLRNVELELRRYGTGTAEARFKTFHQCLAHTAAMFSDPRSLRPQNRLTSLDARPLRIRCPQTLFTTLVLLEYLTLYEHLSADVDLDAAHSAKSLFVRLEQEFEDEVVALPLSAAVLYYRRSKNPRYRPMALLPRGSHRLVDLAADRSCVPEVVLLPGEATAPAYFCELQRYGLLGGSAVGLPCDPVELVRPSEVGATSAVLWFPRNLIYEVFHRGRYLDRAELEIASKESVLLVRKDVLERDGFWEEFLFLLSKAYAALTSNPDVIPFLVESIFARSDFRLALLSEVEHASVLDR